jgi:hypothetical protein
MTDKKVDITIYEDEIKSIIMGINYILSMWNNIKQIDLEEIKNNWEGKDCEIFVGKYLENELQFRELNNLLDIFQKLYNKIYDELN